MFEFLTYFPALEKWALVGDFVGGFGGILALFFIYGSLKKQNEQIQDQKQQIADQRRLGQQQVLLQNFDMLRSEFEQLSQGIVNDAGLVKEKTKNGAEGRKKHYEEQFQAGHRHVYFMLLELNRTGWLSDVLRNRKLTNHWLVCKTVDRYIKLFDILLAQARHLKDGGLMEETLLWSGHGRAYRSMKIAKGSPHKIDSQTDQLHEIDGAKRAA